MNYKNIREKMIKRVMELEKELFMPKHIPKGTPEDPKPDWMKDFTQEEIDSCWCPNCKYPLEYWDEKTDEELQRELTNLEHMKANPV